MLTVQGRRMEKHLGKEIRHEMDIWLVQGFIGCAAEACMLTQYCGPSFLVEEWVLIPRTDLD